MTRRSLITVTTIAWIMGCSVYAYYYVHAILSRPDLSLGYEQDWRFQLLVFFIFRFPLLLMVLIVVVIVELKATKSVKAR